MGGGKLLKHEIIDCGYSLELIFTGLWFLVVLFVLTMTGKFLFDKFDGIKYYLAWCVIWCLFYVLPDVWVFNEIKYLLPFFVGGIFCRKINLQKRKWIGTTISLCAFVVCLHFFSFDKTMYNMGDNIFSWKYIEDTFLRFVCGWFGILLSLYMIEMLQRKLENIGWVAKVGMMTLPIYVLHQKIIIINRLLKIQTDNILIEIVIAIVVTVLTIAMYKILHKNKVLALTLFGESKR